MTARILIVDDLPANTRLLKAKLAAEYYQVTSAGDGPEAVALAEDWQPDLILLDVMMPGMDGYECCRLLKASTATQHIPIVMVTALGEPAERLQGLQAGADDFLTKPVDYEMLLVRVRSLVRLKRLLDERKCRADTASALGLIGRNEPIAVVAGARALIVGWCERTATEIIQALTDDGLSVTCIDGESGATRLLADTAFDLLIVNMSQPDGDLLRFVSLLRASDATHETPVLLVGCPEEKEHIIRAIELGANDWLMQPIDVHELRARARNQVRRKFYQDQLRNDLGTALVMALIDPLTGLNNQRYLRNHLDGLTGSPHSLPFAVLMIDVDHFKLVNDQHGHPSGDRALRMIADSLRINTRASDLVTRYGGEEFVVVVPGAGAPEATAAAERIRAAVEELDFYPVSGLRVQLTVSIGAACCGTGGMPAESYLRSADDALYLAKRNGRNRVELTILE